MMKLHKPFFFAFALLSMVLFTACQKAELPLQLKPTTGETKVVTLELGKDYTTQMFYTLSNDSIRSNEYKIWDLAFEASDNGFHVLLNGGKEIQIANTNSKDWDSIQAYTNAKWLWDDPSGNLTKSAFGCWLDTTRKYIQYPLGKTQNIVYIIDRGTTEIERYKKFRILYVDYTVYMIEFSNLDGSMRTEMLVPKNPFKNYMYISLSGQGNLFDIEPEKDNWDIQFTRYRHIYYDMDPVTPYQVTGVLLNPHLVKVSRDSIIGFDNITIQNARILEYHTEKDFIGFNWKHYDFNTARYEVRQNLTYVIQDTKGVYYKLRFTDFYDNQGIKGAPKFELKRL